MDISGISSLYTDNAKTSASNQTASKLTQAANTDYSNASDEQLMDVCKQFESYFLEQVFKEMQKTVPTSEDESSGANSTLVDYYKDSMTQQIAADSTNNQGLGLAQSLFEQMKNNYGI